MPSQEEGLPTHAMIYAELKVLGSRLETHERDEVQERDERRKDRNDIRDRLGRVEQTMTRIEEGLKPIIASQADHERQITGLEADANRRAGRDGVWAAIARSPLVGWLTAAGAGIAAAVAWMKGDIH